MSCPGARRDSRRAAQKATHLQRFRLGRPNGAVFLTDQPDDDIAQLDLTHRRHARVEDRIRQGKDCGLSNLPFQSFAHNQVWLWLVIAAQDLIAWTAQLCLTDTARCWELKRLRYRLLHQSGPDRPPRPHHDPAPRARLALVRPAHRRVRSAASATATRLTGARATARGPHDDDPA